MQPALSWQVVPARMCDEPVEQAPIQLHCGIVYPATAQPLGAAGFSSGTWSPTVDFDTELSEEESQANSSRNCKPFNLSGSLTAICRSTSKCAPSTPAA